MLQQIELMGVLPGEIEVVRRIERGNRIRLQEGNTIDLPNSENADEMLPVTLESIDDMNFGATFTLEWGDEPIQRESMSMF